MFSHSTPIIPRGSFQVACEKIGGSFGVGDHFGSCTALFSTYTSRYLIQSFTVRCLFPLRTVIGKQTIIFFATIK